MGFISSTLKKGFFWSYPRTSWQWDVLCVLILVFIFLTPKSWFASTGAQRVAMGQEAPVTMVVIGADVVGAQADRAEIERRVRLITGRADTQVTGVRPTRDPAGKVVGYEVDIR
jgi:hypothetical protein